MTIASGIFKELRVKKETDWGVLPGTSGARILRRVTSNLDLNKATYRSNEIRQDQQRAEMRHGNRSVSGTINGELSVGTYKEFFEAILRKPFVAGATTGASTSISTTTTGFAGVNFLTAGFKIGDVVRATGLAATASNNRNFFVTNVTSTALSGVFIDGAALGTAAAGPSVTVAVVGKKCWIPETGHTNDSFSFEHFFNDIDVSEVFTGCRIGQMDIGLPPTGIATCNMNVMGKDMSDGGSEGYFVTPTGATTTPAIAAANGALYLGGVKVGLVTGMSIAINGNMTVGETVGSNFTPDVFVGAIDVSGQLTCYFENATIRDYFLNETEVALAVAFPTGSEANADFLTFVMPRIKTGGAGKDDGDRGLQLTMPYTALLNGAGGVGLATERTTIVVQDSTL